MGLVPVGQAEIDLEVDGEAVTQGVTIDATDESLDITNEATHEVNIHIDGAPNVSAKTADDINETRSPSFDTQVSLPNGETKKVSVKAGEDINVFETTEREKISASVSAYHRDSRGSSFDSKHVSDETLDSIWASHLYNVTIELDGTGHWASVDSTEAETNTNNERTDEYDELEFGIDGISCGARGDRGSSYRSSVSIEAEAEVPTIDIETN